MASVTLQDYIAQVESLLGEEQYDRAIAFCQNALRTHPRCVDFYRMMGQACLETGRPDDAADMFRRVLGADPQDFTARVGLGVVAEGISAYDEAAWQWERALELEPNHAAIRDELQQLRERMGEAERTDRIKLTRTALGYIYMRDEQYNRAANEFRAVLHATSNGGASEHDRFDVQVALAEALYLGGHRREAAEFCRQVLKTLPNAVKPNLILSSIYQDSGRSEEAGPLTERARLLDPANRLAASLLESPLPAVTDVLLELPATGPLVALGTAPAVPVVETTDAAATPVAPLAREEASPDLPEWLRTLRTQTTSEQAAPSATVAESEEPAWLKALHASAPEAVTPVTTLAPEELAAPAESVVPDWVLSLRADAETAETPAAPVDEPLPAWMDETPAALASEPIAAAESAALPVDGATAPIAAEAPPAALESLEMPAWLKALQSQEAERAAPPAPPAAEEAPVAPEPEMPGWLNQLRAPPATPVEAVSSPLVETPPVGAVEATDYLDDASALPSIEAQVAPTGEAEHRARLDLARMLVDLDLNEALDQYAMLAGASSAVVQAALEDLSTLSRTLGNAPRVHDVLRHLGGGTAEPAAAAAIEVVSTPAQEEVSELAQMVAQEELAPFPGEPIVGEESLEAAAPAAEVAAEPIAPALPVVDESVIPAPAAQAREASAYLDDASAPPSVETQATPRGEAEHRALLDLARALKFIDVDEALDTYARLVGAGDPVRTDAINDLSALAAANPRAQELLTTLRGAPPAEAPVPGWVGEAQASMTAAPLAAPAEPIVEEETMLAGVSSAVETPSPALPVVDEEIMDELELPAQTAPLPELRRADAVLAEPSRVEPRPVPVEATPIEAPRAEPVEAMAYLDDATAPPSIEGQAAPTGAEEHAARLGLARTLSEFDVPEALAQYRFLVESGSPLLAQAIDDLSALTSGPAPSRDALLLLADALTRAGRLAEAVALYRKMV